MGKRRHHKWSNLLVRAISHNFRLARNRLSPSKFVFRRNVFFSRFRVWAYFVVKLFLIFYETWLDLEIMHAVPFWAEVPSLALYISTVSEDIRTIFSNHRRVGPLSKKWKTTHSRPYFYFWFHRKHAMSRWRIADHLP